MKSKLVNPQILSALDINPSDSRIHLACYSQQFLDYVVSQCGLCVVPSIVSFYSSYLPMFTELSTSLSLLDSCIKLLEVSVDGQVLSGIELQIKQRHGLAEIEFIISRIETVFSVSSKRKISQHSIPCPEL